MKKIGISVDDKNLNSIVSQGFGKAQYLCVLELDEVTKQITQHQFIDNQYQSSRPAYNLAQISINERLDAVVTGYIGVGPFVSLQAENIEIYHTKGLSVNDIVPKYLDGNLTQLNKPAPNMKRNKKGSKGIQGNCSGSGYGNGQGKGKNNP